MKRGPEAGTLGYALLMGRTASGLSQGELGVELAALRGLKTPIDTKTVWKWENNRAVPDEPNRLALAQFFAGKPGADLLAPFLSIESPEPRSVSEPTPVTYTAPPTAARRLVRIAEELLALARELDATPGTGADAAFLGAATRAAEAVHRRGEGERQSEDPDRRQGGTG